jgi:cation diffusion facilitator CzcD-associated flavoprotein CzcO
MDLDTDVLIVGAGMSGLGLAVQLVREYGHRNFELVEKADHIGGTWLVNSYLGCGVVVRTAPLHTLKHRKQFLITPQTVAHYYSYSFSLNPDWSHKYPL